MSEKFTPGPWRANGDKIESTIGTCRARIAIIDDGAGTNPTANAHLIAAAPTLFEYVNKCAMNGCKEAEYIIKGVTSGS